MVKLNRFLKLKKVNIIAAKTMISRGITSNLNNRKTMNGKAERQFSAILTL